MVLIPHDKYLRLQNNAAHIDAAVSDQALINPLTSPIINNMSGAKSTHTGDGGRVVTDLKNIPKDPPPGIPEKPAYISLYKERTVTPRAQINKQRTVASIQSKPGGKQLKDIPWHSLP
jgi:hypothetical protein